MVLGGYLSDPMKCLAWNCQRAAHSSTRDVLRALILKHKHDILFLCKTKLSSPKSLLFLLSSLSFSNHSVVPLAGRVGGIYLAWFDHNLTTLHCPSVHAQKLLFWDSMQSIAVNLNDPWLAIGDFNDIDNQLEKRGGSGYASSSSGGLQAEMDNLNLNNKRFSASNIRKRLDRAIANEQWLTTFPHASKFHLIAVKLDHKLILLDTDELEVLLRREGELWYQKSRLNWHQFGDANSSFLEKVEDLKTRDLVGDQLEDLLVIVEESIIIIN
ncbi:hypothetical protein CDL12_18232 [Handroanthus impetiginosus]|uniref:Endonuclease/exonuclease/phosphatase domain-containing protein n=1 Tax=Handroanthus impetiginosus TaxID=429701 RepID=A0A2G9GV77_9LAMI|nr:hypothetical protein CDL12_18232 [Handroanthus impetiginosus]